jgi:hypothetical protein
VCQCFNQTPKNDGHGGNAAISFFAVKFSNCPESRYLTPGRLLAMSKIGGLLLLALLSTEVQSSGAESTETVNMADVLKSLEKKSGMFLSQKYFSLIEMPAEYSQHGLCKQVAALSFYFVSKHCLFYHWDLICPRGRCHLYSPSRSKTT